MQISIKTNFPEVQRKLATLHQDIRTKALASAVNKTMEQAKTQMIREITSEYNVSSAYVRERLRIRRATFSAGAFGIEAALIGGDGKRRAANVIRFTEKVVSLAQARKRGKAGTLGELRFKIRKSGGKQLIKGAFIGNRGRTVFVRTGNARLPIKAVSTIDVPQMFNQKKINARVVATINAKFPELFERESKFYISRFNGQG
jgi:cation transport regulator ChaB